MTLKRMVFQPRVYISPRSFHDSGSFMEMKDLFKSLSVTVSKKPTAALTMNWIMEAMAIGVILLSNLSKI